MLSKFVTVSFIPTFIVRLLYRPLGCPSDKLKDSIKVIVDWIESNEKNNSPRNVFNRYFNLPFMKKWDEDSITVFLNHCITHEI